MLTSIIKYLHTLLSVVIIIFLFIIFVDLLVAYILKRTFDRYTSLKKTSNLAVRIKRTLKMVKVLHILVHLTKLLNKLRYFVSSVSILLFFLAFYVQLSIGLFKAFTFILGKFKNINIELNIYISLTLILIIIEPLCYFVERYILLLQKRLLLKNENENKEIVLSSYDNFINSVDKYFNILKPNLFVYIASAAILILSNMQVLDTKYSISNITWSINSSVLTYIAIERIKNYFNKNSNDLKEFYKDFILKIPK